MDDETLLQQDQEPGDGHDDEPQSGSRLRRWLRVLLLLICAACLFFAAVQPGLFGRRAAVTRQDPLKPPTPDPGETALPAQDGALAGTPGLPYREEALMRLEACYGAFHTFYLLEEAANRRPELAADAGWKEDAARSVDGFRGDCGPIGEIPNVPSAYQDVDRWLKLAAAEVALAADGFSAVLGGDSKGSEEIGDHLLRFMEYTRNARALIERLDRRKQI